MADVSKIQLPDGNTYDVKDTTKQPLLVSGTNIKTINNQSLLGSGNLTIGNESDIFVAEYNPQTETGTPFNNIKAAYEAGKHVILDVSAQDSFHMFLPLILIVDRSTSETQNATVGFSIVQNGNNNGTLVSVVCTVHPDLEDSSQSIEEWEIFDFDVQSELESGTNIKTINNQSLLGSGNLTITGSGTSVPTANTVAEFDSTAHMNSTDMTSAEVTSFVSGLDLSSTKAADYIVEQGTDGIWIYQKYQSGMYHAWTSILESTQRNIAYGSSGLYRTDSYTQSLPSFSKANEIFSVTLSANGWSLVGLQSINPANQSFGYFIVGATNDTDSFNQRRMIDVWGKWEQEVTNE